ncbi:MAG: phage tail protein [Gammaproteobacteria bacterium]|nr:phage tail protein [Gammaproteobacteria bacterium]
MSDPYLGEMRMFAGNFAPRSWAFCNGALLSVAENNALFSLLGTTYGGDGRTTFALPEMRGRLPVHHGQGPGLSDRRLGTKLGSESVTLNTTQMPNHHHILNASTDVASSSNPAGDVLASQNDGDIPYATQPEDPVNVENMNSQTLAMAGGNQFHNNMMPYLSISFIIALFGIYPSRS